MEEVIIRGKNFSREEVVRKGSERIRKIVNLFRWLGLGLIATGIIGGIAGIVSLPKDADTSTLGGMIGGTVILAGSGVVLFVLSFKKRDPFKYGKEEIEKNFPAPTGFDGQVIDVLEGDKTVELSKRPLSRLIVDSKSKKFQLYAEGHYTRTYTPNDLLDYEIRVDNEVVITSKTKTKKGVGKAIAGGLLFGEAGAVAGAVAGGSKSTTTETQKEIHHYSLLLKVNDLSKSSFVINVDSVHLAEEAAAVLAIIQKDYKNIEELKNEEPSSEKKVPEHSEPDKFEEIKKYKDLLDSGIITKEEFEIKKKELLG